MKYLWILALVAAAVFGVTGCASTNTTTTASGDPVPGERISDEGRLQPGAGTGPNASVKW